MSYSNRSSLNYLLKAILLIAPFLASRYNVWSWIVEMFILLIIFMHGKESGPLQTIFLTLLGYSSAIAFAVSNGSFSQIGYVPLAGLLFVFLQNKISIKAALFWSLVLTVLISALPTIGIVRESLKPEKIDEVVAFTIQNLEQNGNLQVLEDKGVSREMLEGYIKKLTPVYYEVLPAAAAVISMLEYIFIYTLFRRLLVMNYWEAKKKVPFSRWRMPWYAIWGVNIGLATYLLGDTLAKVAVLKIVGLNILCIYAAVGIVFGFSCLAYLLQRPATPRFLTFIIIIGGAIYLPFTLTIITFIGIFDIVFNLRRIPEGIEREEK
jgi:hypothetical protein